MQRIVLATTNPGKLREIRQGLGDLPIDVLGPDVFGEIDEPAEDGPTFAANAAIKARYYARATAAWCLADDSGLLVDALDGAPGVHSARYAAERVPASSERSEIDAANNTKLLENMADIPDAQRTARFVCHLALSDGQTVLLEACGTVEGRIARAPSGENGFGYDPLFIADETGCAVAELSAEQKNRISHRGKAVRRFAELLRAYLHENADG